MMREYYRTVCVECLFVVSLLIRSPENKKKTRGRLPLKFELTQLVTNTLSFHFHSTNIGPTRPDDRTVEKNPKKQQQHYLVFLFDIYILIESV